MPENTEFDEFVYRDAARILDLTDDNVLQALQPLGSGMRTRAVLVTGKGVAHRLGSQRVVIKLYKGRGNPSGGAPFIAFHGTHFQLLADILNGLPVQRSLESGRWRIGHVPYALLEYVEGDLLRNMLNAPEKLPWSTISGLIRSLLQGIWIPVWSRGLRFKDCHPGNFLRTGETQLTMIDTDQLRKDAAELLESPQDWTERNKHERSGLRRLPGLLIDLLQACDQFHNQPRTGLKRSVNDALTTTRLAERLSVLGRVDAGEEDAITGVESLIEALSPVGSTL